MSEFSKVFREMCVIGDKKRDEHLRVSDKVMIYRDIPYIKGTKDVSNWMDIYLPGLQQVEDSTKHKKGAEKKFPVILSVHGGAYVYGNKEVYQYYGYYMAEQGFAFVNMNYHLAPEKKFPTQLGEVNAVLQWILENGEEYQLDTNNIFLVGDSAGAQMASHYCAIYANPDFAGLYPFTVPEHLVIRAVALNCGMYDIDASVEELYAAREEIAGMKQTVMLDDYLGLNRLNFDEMLKVKQNITTKYPPAYIMTSYYDFLKTNAKPMYMLLQEKGVPAEYHLYGKEGQEYMGHVFHCNMNLEEARECNRDECRFFREYLIRKM